MICLTLADQWSQWLCGNCQLWQEVSRPQTNDYIYANESFSFLTLYSLIGVIDQQLDPNCHSALSGPIQRLLLLHHLRHLHASPYHIYHWYHLLFFSSSIFSCSP